MLEFFSVVRNNPEWTILCSYCYTESMSAYALQLNQRFNASVFIKKIDKQEKLKPTTVRKYNFAQDCIIRI